MSEPFMLPLQFLAQLTGIPYAGLKAYFYAAGTFNNQTVYRDAALTTPHEQPVQADDNGFLPPIYKNPNAAADYRVVLRDAFDTLIPNGDVDQIPRRPLWALPFAPLSVKTSPYNAQGNDAADDRAASR